MADIPANSSDATGDFFHRTNPTRKRGSQAVSPWQTSSQIHVTRSMISLCARAGEVQPRLRVGLVRLVRQRRRLA